jgi:hypothetical protein
MDRTRIKLWLCQQCVRESVPTESDEQFRFLLAFDPDVTEVWISSGGWLLRALTADPRPGEAATCLCCGKPSIATTGR